jgi:iron complex outermembrane receptor protein
VILTAASAGAEESAAPPAQNLDAVVVTATRTERQVEEVPAAVTVVTREELKNERMLGIKEALNGIAGVQSESKNGGYDARLIIRGAGLKARYGVREIMVLLDGVPITDPDGMSRFDFVDTQLVERIDVLKGPNSTLYGANAAGGVVNILTVNPYEEIRSFRVGYGSDNTSLSNAIFSKNFNDTSYLTLFGTRKSSDGWRQWNEFDSTQSGLKFGQQLNDSTSFDVNFTYTDANLQLPGTLTKAQFDQNIRQLTTEPFRHGGRYSEIYYLSLQGDKEFTPNLSYKPIVYYQNWQHIHPVPGVINDGGAQVYGTDQQLTFKHRALGRAATLVTGATLQIDDSKGDKYAYRDYTTTTGIPTTGRITATLSDAMGAKIETDSDVVTKWGFYAQESLNLGDDWLVDVGARFDQVIFDLSANITQEYSYSTGNYVIPAVSKIDIAKTYNYVSPRIGVVYKLMNGLNLYGNISTGFQTPQSGEISDNPDLDPAVTVNYETGFKGNSDAGDSVELALFYMEVSDEIIQTIAPGGVSTYSNAGETHKKGVELAAQTRSFKGLRLGGTYTWSDFTFADFTEPVNSGPPTFTTTNVSRNGNQLPYIPEHQYSLFAFYKHSCGFKTRIETNTWGAYYVDNANSARYEGYKFLTSLMVGWENEQWDIVIDVDNLFNKHYAMEVAKDTSGKVTYRPGAPVSTFGKVTYKF